jgi:hypothetical protein
VLFADAAGEVVSGGVSNSAAGAVTEPFELGVVLAPAVEESWGVEVASEVVGTVVVLDPSAEAILPLISVSRA